ncbi:uncharacterized protein LOC123194133 isoform X1 [Mangifera indica]|uniref:uncharacterized protein LOC123194133 isoform X1 n=2 Tax=Mangifera indica TaxID=29780 RepID=UPI001CFA6548|nr:uncharacterized protein LOC123194133 isoform X1 [Mangifera indica]
MDEGNTNSGMTETDVKAMRETLCAQQQLLQNLYAELDVEREASSTAVSEALSMILRLQEEKSAIVMEASQYKRMSEAKICHVEEYLAIFEDILYQKEMEIAALEFQIQAYKYRLLSLGYTELDVSESRFSENPYMQKNDTSIGESGAKEGVRRLNSMPPLRLQDIYQTKSTIVREKSLTPKPEMISPLVDEKPCQDFIENGLQSTKNSSKPIVGEFNTYWEQIKKFDEKVKEFADYKDTGGYKSASLKTEARTSTLLSQLSNDISSDLRRCKTNTNFDKLKECKTLVEREQVLNSSCSSSVYDIFEVPKVSERRKSYEKEEKGKNKQIWGGENKLWKPDLVADVTLDSHVKDETERVKTVLYGTKPEKRLPISKEVRNADFKLPLAPHKISQAETHVDIHSEIQQLSQRVEQLERVRHSARNETVTEREGELNLLKEIRKQLNLVQSEMQSWRTKNSCPVDEPSLLPLQEAMLHFWL